MSSLPRSLEFYFWTFFSSPLREYLKNIHFVIIWWNHDLEFAKILQGSKDFLFITASRTQLALISAVGTIVLNLSAHKSTIDHSFVFISAHGAMGPGSWVFMAAHEHKWTLMSTNEYWAMVTTTLMNANDPELFVKMFQNMKFCFGISNSDTFLLEYHEIQWKFLETYL